MCTDKILSNRRKSKINNILLRLIYVYIKEARDRLNIQKTTISPYISHKQMKYKIENALPFTLAASKMKYIYKYTKICTKFM